MKTENAKVPPKLFTIIEIAEFVGVSAALSTAVDRAEALIAHHFNGVVRLSDADFQAFCRPIGASAAVPYSHNETMP